MLRELLDDVTGLDDVAGELELGDELAVRSALIRLGQLKRDAERVKRTAQAVAESYAAQLDRVEQQTKWLRESVAAYVERFGTAKFPDAGTAYLAKGGPKIVVEDRDAFKRAVGDLFVKETFDETAAKAYALEQALDVGELLPGVTLVPGGPELRIRA